MKNGVGTMPNIMQRGVGVQNMKAANPNSISSGRVNLEQSGSILKSNLPKIDQIKKAGNNQAEFEAILNGNLESQKMNQGSVVKSGNGIVPTQPNLTEAKQLPIHKMSGENGSAHFAKKVESQGISIKADEVVSKNSSVVNNQVTNPVEKKGLAIKSDKQTIPVINNQQVVTNNFDDKHKSTPSIEKNVSLQSEKTVMPDAKIEQRQVAPSAEQIKSYSSVNDGSSNYVAPNRTVPNHNPNINSNIQVNSRNLEAGTEIPQQTTDSLSKDINMTDRQTKLTDLGNKNYENSDLNKTRIEFIKNEVANTPNNVNQSVTKNIPYQNSISRYESQIDNSNASIIRPRKESRIDSSIRDAADLKNIGELRQNQVMNRIPTEMVSDNKDLIFAQPEKTKVESFDLSNLDTSLDSQKIIDKITNYIVQSKIANKAEIGMSFIHDELGKVDIMVRRERGNEKLAISIATHTAEANDFFNKNQSLLARGLDNAGIKVGSLNFSHREHDYRETGSNISFFSRNEDRSYNDDRREEDSQRRRELWEAIKERRAA